eukprot:TRINITY_DN4515_c0_g1_i1.p2 TRINITY_DN4515_c0_g1~~TRINITY_DN4515_c0_g1_i1.p2  ORF type:complete len:172 (-),score=38.75 TRINITY_DN4515_c0_g1_i1:2375-2890(-)
MANSLMLLEFVLLFGWLRMCVVWGQTQANIIDVIYKKPNLSTFYQVIVDTDLDRIFGQDADAFTIFAPSNDAFIDTFDMLNTTMPDLEQDMTMLSKIVLHHVVLNVFNSSDLLDGTELTSFIGLPLFVDASEGVTRVEGLGSAAQILETDIFSGGVMLHVIDFLLLPFEFN